MAKDNREVAIYTAFDESEPYDETVPEKNLLKAILLSALADLRRPGEAGRKASEYFLSRDESYIFSFVSVCSFLSIDPQKILMVAGLVPGSHTEVQQVEAQLSQVLNEIDSGSVID